MKDDERAEAAPAMAMDADGYLWFTLVRAGERTAPGQTTAIRLIGLLPPEWDCLSVVDHDRIALGVPHGAFPGTPDELRARLERVVTDSALTGWSLAP